MLLVKCFAIWPTNPLQRSLIPPISSSLITVSTHIVTQRWLTTSVLADTYYLTTPCTIWYVIRHVICYVCNKGACHLVAFVMVADNIFVLSLSVVRIVSCEWFNMLKTQNQTYVLLRSPDKLFPAADLSSYCFGVIFISLQYTN